MNLKVALREYFPPTTQASVVGFQEVRGKHEFGEVTVVGKYLDYVSSLSEVVPVMGKGMNDSVKFLVMDVPILFGGVEFVMKKEKGVPPVVVFLLEDAGVGLVGGVR